MRLVLLFAAAMAGASPPEVPLTLIDAITQARQSSPLLGAARSQADGTADAARLVPRLLNPMFDLRIENLGSGAPSGMLPPDVFAEASMPIELNGRRRLRAAIAGADRDLAAGHLQSATLDVTARTTRIYFAALAARALVDTATANREGLTSIVETLTRRVAEGVTAEADLLRFKTEAARLDIEVARAGLALDRSLNQLAFVIGATSPIVASQLIEPAPVPPPALDAAALSEAIGRHPEVAAASARVARARHGSALEHSRRVPDPIVGAGYKRTAGFDTGIIAISVPVPLFDRNRPAAAKAAGEERAAAADHEATARRLAADAAALMTTARVLAERSARTTLELLEPAAAGRAAARAAFREGAIDVVRLIDAERVYSDVQRLALELRLEALATAFEARLAVGEELQP